MSPEPGLPVARERGPSAVVPGETYPDRDIAVHRFVGPDYSVLDDFPYPDDLEASAAAQEEYAALIQRLLGNSVRISSVHTDRMGAASVVTVALESLTTGHRVPTGFTSERQLWVHLTVTDATGRTIFESGDLDSDGNLRDAHSHDVIAGIVDEDEQLVNLQSRNVVIKRTYGDNGALESDDGSRFETETIFPFDADFIDRRSLEPLEVRPFRYEVDDLGGQRPLTVNAALRYRNLPPYVLQSLHADEYIEKLRIFNLDEAEVVVD